MTPKYRGVILDVDGVLKRGDKPIPGASEVVDKLREAGIKVVILSNLSSKSREDYVETLKSLGIKVAPEDLVLATSATATYVARNRKRGTVYYVGHEGLRRELEKAGLRIVEDPLQAEFVVAGSPFDSEGNVTEENKGKFAGAIRAILLAKAKFIAVNPDTLYPAPDGKINPGTGTFIGAIKAATGVEPVIIGKPSKIIFKEALRKLNLPPEEVVMVGDQVHIDLIPAKELGMTTVLVLTGLTSREDVEKMDEKLKSKIDYVINSIADLPRIIGVE